ncbi:MAG: hypothetical protein ACTSP8_04985 [Promethearchaeota archaeon]
MIGRARIDLGGFIIGRIAKEGRTFEMLLAPDQAWKAKKMIRDEINKRLVEGKDKSRFSVDELLKNPKISIDLIFESFIVFEDLRRGKKATDGDMEAVFNTSEGRIIAGHILLDGEIKWTRSQRDEEKEKKLKQVITIITKNAINPQNKKPHPYQRIEKAIEEAKVKVDLMRSAKNR